MDVYQSSIITVENTDWKGWSLDLPTIDDGALLTIIAGTYGIRSSDPALNGAISELYDRYGRLIYTIAIHVVGDAETAEEITQDVFVRVCEGARSYRPEMARVSSWLVSIARHRAIDELRRRGVRPEKDSIDWPEEADPSGLDDLLMEDGPEEAAETTLQQRNLRQVIASLPPDQRQVLGLAYFKGMSHNEIAGLLGEPLGTVKSRIRLAMQKLRDTLIERGMIEL
jgi:RNA polymerase sigma-70 factor, ECF subfamily